MHVAGIAGIAQGGSGPRVLDHEHLALAAQRYEVRGKHRIHNLGLAVERIEHWRVGEGAIGPALIDVRERHVANMPFDE